MKIYYCGSLPFLSSLMPNSNNFGGKFLVLLSLLISIVIVPSWSLHCHRKHDHSSDILLQGNDGGGGTARVGPVVAGSSSSDTFFTAKLVGKAPNNIEKSTTSEIRSRDLLYQNNNGQVQEVHYSNSSPVDVLCPKLAGCTCNFTSGTSRLQVIYSIKLYLDVSKH